MDETPTFIHPFVGWKILRIKRETQTSYIGAEGAGFTHEDVFVHLKSPQVGDNIWLSTKPSVRKVGKATCDKTTYSILTPKEGPLLMGEKPAQRRLRKTENHESPDPDCNCGYNSYHTLQDMEDDIEWQAQVNIGRRDPDKVPYLLRALVQGWGETVSYDNHFASEYMKICALVEPIEIEEARVRFVAKKEDIPVISLEEAEETYEDYGISLKGWK